MPVYAVRIRGQSEVQLVQAASASQARNHVAEAETVTADELADYVGKGLTIAKATREVPAEEPQAGKLEVQPDPEKGKANAGK
jgi:hypothetical protein